MNERKPLLMTREPEKPALKFKKLNPKAEVPRYATDGAAGLDLTATSCAGDEDDARYLEYGTGLAVEIPRGYVGLLFPRSSITKMGLNLKNAVGVIDSDYRGEIRLRFQHSTDELVTVLDLFAGVVEGMIDNEPMEKLSAELARFQETYQPLQYKVGDKVGQLVVLELPRFEVEEAGELTDTARGHGGFGHTGQ